MSKTIIGIDWPVVDIILDFPDKLRSSMLEDRNGAAHFETLTRSLLINYQARLPHKIIPGGTMTNMLATVAALGGKAALIGVTGPDENGRIARANLFKRGIELLVDILPEAVSPVMYAMRRPDGEVIYKPVAGSARTGLTGQMIRDGVKDPANTIMATQLGFITHQDISPDVHEAVRDMCAQGAQLALGLQCIRRGTELPSLPTDYIFGNVNEFSNLLQCQPKSSDIRDAIMMRDLGSTGPGHILTEGPHGLSYIQGTSQQHWPAARLNSKAIACTIGAGDAVMGGFLQGMAMDLGTSRALYLATLTAREALRQEGGLPKRTEPGHMARLLERQPK